MIIVCAGVDVFAKAKYDAVGLGIAVFVATASGDGRKLFVDKLGVRLDKGLRVVVGEGQARLGSQRRDDGVEDGTLVGLVALLGLGCSAQLGLQRLVGAQQLLKLLCV